MEDREVELRGALYLNAAALLLTVFALMTLHQVLRWWGAALLLRAYAPLGLAVYVVALLLSYLALRQGQTARQVSPKPLLSATAMVWSFCNAALIVYGGVKLLIGAQLAP